MTIEPASIHDLNKLCEIEEKCFTAEAFTRRELALLLCAYNSISLAAKSGNEIVGFIIGRLRLERDTIIGHVITIDVSASNHSRGIGQTLLQEIEKAFKEKNAKMCQLEVREDNAHALRLYRKNGYVEIGKLKNYYGSKHGLCMMKKLA